MRGRRQAASAPVAGLIAAALLFAGACSSGSGGGASLVLDGSPRVPDAEGIASIARADLIEVAGKQYEVSPDLVAFSTHDMALTPLVRWQGSYVQVGLDGDTVVWLAGVAGIISGDRPVAEFTGQIDTVDGDQIVLEGGTVVTLAEGAKAYPPGAFVIVRLDPITGLVRELIAA